MKPWLTLFTLTALVAGCLGASGLAGLATKPAIMLSVLFLTVAAAIKVVVLVERYNGRS